MKVGVVEAFAHPAMAAIGTKRTFRDGRSMSAIGGKADIVRTCRNVRL
jgi:hypothetical protein